MDKPLRKTRWQRWRTPLLSSGGLLVIVSLWLYTLPSGGRSLSVNQQHVEIARVEWGEFEDFIPVRAQVMPLRTLYLDSIEGGRVEKIHIEDGADVLEGQPLVDIANSNLQLNSFSLETQVSEQLNNMQSQELRLTQNKLMQKRELNEVNHQIQLTENKLARYQSLVKTKSVAQADVIDTDNELRYLQQRRQLMLEAIKADQALQEAQLNALRDSVAHLQNNLAFAKGNLDKLNVKAPTSGKLTAFNLELGQSLKPGDRFGQIDDPHNIKLVAQVDEFYMPRLFIGQAGELEFQQKHYGLRIKKIYPQVTNGQFQVDMIFSEMQPPATHRGQTMQLRLQLGENAKALLLPNSAFYQDTGGNWAFVVNPDKASASKRTIKLGRRNSRMIEVLDGLSAGEQVVTSSYSNYINIDKLNLQTPDRMQP